MKKIIYVLLFLPLIGLSQTQDLLELKGPYLGMNPPGLEPEIFAPGIISTELHDDGSPAFSLDGNEVYFRIAGHINNKPRGVIFYMRRENGIWTIPQIAPFSSEFMDGGVVFSPDNKRIYFISQRPLEGNMNEIESNKIWFVERVGNSLTKPQLWNVPLNKYEVGTGFSISKNGNVYTALNLTGEEDADDIYIMRLVNGSYQEPENIGVSINSDGWEGAACISSDESYLIFNSIREGELGLYVSFHKENDSWSKPIRLAEDINKGGSLFAGISPDSKYLFFVGHRVTDQTNPPKNWETDIFQGPQVNWGGDVYWVSTKIIRKLKQKNI